MKKAIVFFLIIIAFDLRSQAIEPYQKLDTNAIVIDNQILELLMSHEWEIYYSEDFQDDTTIGFYGSGGIHYTSPSSFETYINRPGRTGNRYAGIIKIIDEKILFHQLDTIGNTIYYQIPLNGSFTIYQISDSSLTLVKLLNSKKSWIKKYYLSPPKISVGKRLAKQYKEGTTMIKDTLIKLGDVVIVERVFAVVSKGFGHIYQFYLHRNGNKIIERAFRKDDAEINEREFRFVIDGK
jgi:hypothetical protein